MERCRRDADFRSKWMVEPIDDEQEQAQQQGDPAREGHVNTSAAEMDETRDYLVYRDADRDGQNGGLSVLVRRRDGHFDLIES